MRPQDGIAELQQRIAGLDDHQARRDISESLASPDRQAIVDDAKRFIGVLGMVTSGGDHGMTPIISSTDADLIVSSCHLVRRLGSAIPLVTGEMTGYPQYWISTGKVPWLPPSERVLSPEHFVAPTELSRSHHVNPFGIGLYTSTGFQGTQGMWRIFLDLGHYSSNFPLPWHVWKINISTFAKIYEVSTAAQWQELVLQYPVINDGLLYPDWAEIAKDWDAIHITIGAIAAIQGMRIQTSRGLLAPSYWDVETTFWLRWSFASAMLVEMVEEDGVVFLGDSRT